MGLDMVELAMAIEADLDLEIPDEVLERLRTVGELHAFILGVSCARQGDADADAPDGAPACPSSRLFYRLRRTLMAHTDTPKARVQPATPLRSLASPFEQRNLWRCIARDMQMWALRPTLHPAFLTSLWVLAIPAILWPYMAGDVLISIPRFLLAGGTLAALIAAARYLPLPLLFPGETRTVGDLVRFAVEHEVVPAEGRFPGGSSWEYLCRRIEDYIGCPREAIRPEAKFYEDLGAG